MLRSIGAVAAGIVVGAAVIFVVEGLGHVLFPPPAGVDLKNSEALAAIMETIPVGAKIAVVIAWFAGIFAGGLVALAIGRKWAPLAWVVAAALFGMAAITMMEIPHPWWMMAGALTATLVGAVGAIRLVRANYARPVRSV